MVKLLIDLVAARLSYSPIPIQLLETLSIIFDRSSVFQPIHRSKPYDCSLYDKQVGEHLLGHSPSSSMYIADSQYEPHGWLCLIINRFVLKNGIENL